MKPCSFLLTLLFAATLLFACAKPKPANVSAGRLEQYALMGGDYLTPRDVAVWLPPAYDRGDTCDVLYMHDGQMLFDSTITWNHQEWQVDEVVARLIEQDKIRPCIVVAINNDEQKRLDDYFPQRTCDYVDSAAQGTLDPKRFHSDAYLRFIVEELKPLIDANYRVYTGPDHTFVMGSSMGGLISLYALCEYPNVFGGAACMSTHLSMMLPNALGGLLTDNAPWAVAFRSYAANQLPAANSRLLYMDRGTETIDTAYGVYQDAFDEMVRNKGWDEAHYFSRVFPGHAHDEISWAKRLDQPLIFLLGKNK